MITHDLSWDLLTLYSSYEGLSDTNPVYVRGTIEYPIFQGKYESLQHSDTEQAQFNLFKWKDSNKDSKDS